MDVRRLYKSDTDKMICGVCGGIGEFLNVDPTLVRLLWAILTFTGRGSLPISSQRSSFPAVRIKETAGTYMGTGADLCRPVPVFFSGRQGAFPGPGLFPWPAPRSEKDMCPAFQEAYGARKASV